MNIVLIGMPGAGKSTIGAKLARTLEYDFIDTDDVIKERINVPLQQLVDEQGVTGFIKKEGQIISNLFLDHYVIATGGSAVYSENAMLHLKKNSVFVYLKLRFPTIKFRIHNIQTRGIAMKKNQTLYQLYKERAPLYEKYADITILCDHKQKKQIIDEIKIEIEKLQK